MPAKLASLFLLAACCSGQTTLRQYLSLTDAQAVSILQLNQAYQNTSNANLIRRITLNNELTGLMALPNTDPIDLGSRAVAIEQIRRDQLRNQGVLQGKTAALLSTQQTALIQNLAAASALLPLAADANCAYLAQISPPPLNFYPPSFVLGAIYKPLSSAPTTSACDPSPFPISIRVYLSLTDLQVAAISQRLAAFNDSSSRLQNRIADLNQQIQMSADVDATTLGLLYLEIDTTRKEISRQDAELRTAAKAQLTPSQQSELKQLQDAIDLRDSGVIGNAEDCNLLPSLSGSAAQQAGLTGALTYCRL